MGCIFCIRGTYMESLICVCKDVLFQCGSRTMKLFSELFDSGIQEA